MKRDRGLWDDERGVSAAVGAVLIAAILFSAYLTVQLHFVPVWEKESEEAHMGRVMERFGDARGLLDASSGGSGAGGSFVLPLSPAKPFLGTGMSVHGIAFHPDGYGVQTNAQGFLAIPEHGRDMFDEAWAPIPSSVHDVMKVMNLRFRFDSVGGHSNDGKEATFTLQGHDGTLLGSFQAKQVRQPPEAHLVITVRDAAGTVLYSNPESVFIAHSVSPYWVDALEPRYRFAGVVEKAQKPLRIEVDGDLAGSFAINYENETGFQGPTPPPTLEAGSPFVVDDDCGSLVYRGNNARLVPQDLVLEHGAVILSQGDGSVFRSPPYFFVRHNPDWTTIDVKLHCLVGEPASHAATDHVSVSVVRLEDRTAWGFLESLYLNVTTAFPELWMEHWQDSLRAAGLASGDHYLLEHDTATDTVRLHLTGADPGSVDIRVNLVQPMYKITIRS